VVELPSAQAVAQTERKRSSLRIGSVVLGEGTFVLISGPCAVESLDQIVDAARMVRAAGATILRGGAFKPRTSPHAFQGLGMEGLRYLQQAGRQFDMPVVTEVLTIEDIPAVMAHADVLQVGARNMHNFALLKELGRIDKPVILKRGMSATVKELLLAAEYLLAGGNLQVILCERGIRTFETSTRATLDVSSVPVLKRLTHLPIIVDPSHAAGDRELVIPLALAAAAAGADGLIVEAHPRPQEALCDKEQALNPDDVTRMVAGLRPIVAAQGRIW
jgi:3-deoxy-7-phosphoheptulonate synthase